MRILFVSARGDAFGGASLHVRDMARRLMDDGHQVKIAVGGTADMEVPRRFAEKNLDFDCIAEMGRSIDPAKDIRSMLKLRKIAKTFQPDLVSCHASKGGAIGRIACLGLGVPVLYTPHCWSFVDGFPKADFYQRVESMLARFTTKIIAVCEDERAFGLEKGVGTPEQTVCIHNGVIDTAPSAKTTRKGGNLQLLMVARFEAQKDHPLLIRTLARLQEFSWNLTLVGDGPTKSACVALAEELGIADRLQFIGYSSQVEEHLAQSDVFLLVSNWEGFPRSILEAMRAGLPVVASDVGGCKEAIDEETGRIVTKGDLDQLTAALGEILANPEKCQAMGQKGRERFEERFTFEVMYARYRKLYESLVRNPVSDAASFCEV